MNTQTKTATITGSRTMHPRHGATSDISVTIGGEKSGPFAYMADAYRDALAQGVDPSNIMRNGKRMRRPAGQGWL